MRKQTKPVFKSDFVFLDNLGNLKLTRLRRRLQKVMSRDQPDISAARQTLGEIFYLIQMFYSNTNWVEMAGNQICHSLGEI